MFCELVAGAAEKQFRESPNPEASGHDDIDGFALRSRQEDRNGAPSTNSKRWGIPLSCSGAHHLASNASRNSSRCT